MTQTTFNPAQIDGKQITRIVVIAGTAHRFTDLAEAKKYAREESGRRHNSGRPDCYNHSRVSLSVWCEGDTVGPTLEQGYIEGRLYGSTDDPYTAHKLGNR